MRVESTFGTYEGEYHYCRDLYRATITGSVPSDAMQGLPFSFLGYRIVIKSLASNFSPTEEYSEGGFGLRHSFEERTPPQLPLSMYIYNIYIIRQPPSLQAHEKRQAMDANSVVPPDGSGIYVMREGSESARR
jgi:hypothetical protein